MAIGAWACAPRAVRAVIRVSGWGWQRRARGARWGAWAAAAATRCVCRQCDCLLPSYCKERDCRDIVRLLLVMETLQDRRMQLAFHQRQR